MPYLKVTLYFFVVLLISSEIHICVLSVQSTELEKIAAYLDSGIEEASSDTHRDIRRDWGVRGRLISRRIFLKGSKLQRLGSEGQGDL